MECRISEVDRMRGTLREETRQKLIQNLETVSQRAAAVAAAAADGNYYPKSLKQQAMLLRQNATGTNSSGAVFVLEWYDDNESIIGVGSAEGEQQRALKLRVAVPPGLFVVTHNPHLLAVLVEAQGYRVVQTNIAYDTNTFALHDLFENYNYYARKAYLCKIETNTFSEALNLFYRYSKDPQAYKYACVSPY